MLLLIQVHVCKNENGRGSGQDIVFEYVSSLLHRALETASMRGKLKYEDFVWQVRDVSFSITGRSLRFCAFCADTSDSFTCRLQEPNKLERLKELLEQNEEIKKARKVGRKTFFLVRLSITNAWWNGLVADGLWQDRPACTGKQEAGWRWRNSDCSK